MSVAVGEPARAAHSAGVEALVDFGHRFAALLLLLVLSPVMVAIAVLVLLTSGGPVFYRQVRIGQYGRRFRIVKFRTMHRGADARLAAVLAAEGHGEITPFFKVKDDPRITRVGRVLRRASLDELPQLVNVLVGDMRLVGPRPQSPAEVATYDTLVWRRLLVRPGVTGMWQVNGRSDLTAEQGLELDLAYVRDWSPGLDARLLFKTPFAVVGQRGAY